MQQSGQTTHAFQEARLSDYVWVETPILDALTQQMREFRQSIQDDLRGIEQEANEFRSHFDMAKLRVQQLESDNQRMLHHNAMFGSAYV